MPVSEDGADPSITITTVEEASNEEDYMSMLIVEPVAPKVQETYTQRRLRKAREAEARSRTKSKAEMAAEAAAAREAALQKSLLEKDAPKSKGLAMMAKMGFKPGAALGSGSDAAARTEPIMVEMKEGRGGIGLDAEKKRKFREEVEGVVKKAKAEEGDYRERVRREREQGKLEAQVAGAMRTAERLAGEQTDHKSMTGTPMTNGDKSHAGTPPMKQIKVLWRGLAKEREEQDRDRRMKRDMQQGLSSQLPTYEDDDEDEDDKKALGKDSALHTTAADLEDEDAELDAFNALEAAERLQKLLIYLRVEHQYCFWCKFTYPDEAMDGCPGLTEDDHD